MSKFIIECPQCGTYHEASNSFFAKKEILCNCGYNITVKRDKFIIKECAHCGNTVIYDQSKGSNAKCVVCGNVLFSDNDKKHFEQIECPSCSCELTVSKDSISYVCPLCKTTVDVQEEIEKTKIRKKGLPSVIKYEGSNNVVIWKHPITDFNLGSQLIVHESQEAIFFKDGKACDTFGAGRYTLSNQQLPMLNELYKLPIDGNIFHSEIYYINLITHTNIKWGTDSKVRMFDPISGLHIELGACGEFNIKVINGRKLLIKLVGTTEMLKFNENDVFDYKFIASKFKSLVVSKVKSILSKTIKEHKINVLEVDEHIDDISAILKREINIELEEYGVNIPEFYITSILTPDDDPNFRRLKEQHAARYLKVEEQRIRSAEAIAAQEAELILATTEAKKKAILAEGTAAEISTIGQAEAQVLKAKGGNYSMETARIVGKAAAENESNEGSSFASEMLKTGVGFGFGVQMTKNVMGAVDGVINNVTNDNMWNCPNCHQMNITTAFCPSCGFKKIEEANGWNCPNCHQTDIKTAFCPNCGTKKPDEIKRWDCPNCNQTHIGTAFCPNCGTKRPVDNFWDCDCGTKEIKTTFCPNCGKKRA